MEQELIFQPMEEQCHASTVVSLSGGRYMAAWFAGAMEGDYGVGIRLSIRENGGWRRPVTVAKIKYEPHWNPVLFRISKERIALYFKVGAIISGWRTYVMYTDDAAERWTEPKELVEGDRSGGRGPVKNPPIMTSNGIIVAPASVERGYWDAFTDISYDNGESWERGENVPLPDVEIADEARGNRLGVIQPTLWEASPGRISMLLRSNGGFIYRSDSRDWGRTWSKARKTSLANNNSGICVARFKDGRLLLAANPIGGNWAARNVLSLFISKDDGETWGEPFNIVKEEGLHEFSYPTVIALDDDRFAMTYTHDRTSIAFVSGSLSEL